MTAKTCPDGSTTISFSALERWVAGVFALFLSTASCAVIGVAWQTRENVIEMRTALTDIHDMVKDHEARIRTVESAKR